LDACDEMLPGGGTDLNGGLQAGYSLAQKHFSSDRINRVILISDGGANMGVTDGELIGAAAADDEAAGIYMVGVGVGASIDYNDELMDDVTDAGKGASVFVPSRDAPEIIFGERFLSTMGVFARNVQIELDLPAGFEIVTFSGEAFSTDPREIDPQHLAPNDAMVFYQTVKTCAPEALLPESEIGITLRYQDPTTRESRFLSVETTFSDLLNASPVLLPKGAAIFHYAEALKTSDPDDIAAAQAQISEALKALPEDTELLEIQSLLGVLTD